jgi:mannose-6-phosphate isomerase-like protein (cupin superfamily)
MEKFATARLPISPAALAPDGTDVRPLLQLRQGSFAHFELAPGKTSFAVAHRSVEEIWFFLAGEGEVWRKNKDQEATVAVDAGVCITIPLGTEFQFRCVGSEPLAFVAVTMPPWPGDDEAYRVEGKWRPTS